MIFVRSKHPRLRLAANEYDELRQQVLRRDGWRCQLCGEKRNLEVHHKELRSHSGDDSERNLITLCAIGVIGRYMVASDELSLPWAFEGPLQ